MRHPAAVPLADQVAGTRVSLLHSVAAILCSVAEGLHDVPQNTEAGMRIILCTCICLLVAHPVLAFELSVVSYNVESDSDTDATAVAQDIQRIPQSHIWGLVEVDTPDLEAYRAAIGQDFVLIPGNTGQYSNRPDDRMAIIFDSDVLEQIGQTEELSAAGGSRHPLLARFRVKATGQEFWFVLNHLQRGREETRQAQADWLNKWAQGKADNQVPPSIVLLGDYNFDVTPYTKRGNEAFDLFMQDGMFRWVEPGCLAANSCPLTGTGCHPQFNSILDFVFLAGPARRWSASSEILFKDDADYCALEGQGGADHRPVRAILTF